MINMSGNYIMYLGMYIASDSFIIGVYSPETEGFIFNKVIEYKEDFHFDSALQLFLEEYEMHAERKAEISETFKTIKHSVIAAGGISENGEIEVNHGGTSFTVNKEKVSQTLKAKEHSGDVALINDFEVLAYSVLFCDQFYFEKSDLLAINGSISDISEGSSEEKFTTDKTGRDKKLSKSLIVGPDKGLGVASLSYGALWNGKPYIESSEGGHLTFSPEWPDAIKLVEYVQKTQSNEEILSHRGIKEIYNYFLFEREYSPNYRVTHTDIIRSAFSGNHNPAVSTVRFFCEMLGALCGNFANTFNCDHSIFIWSETLDDIETSFLSHHFQKRFSSRPKHGERIGRVPVFIIKSKRFPLFGCALYSQYWTKGS